MRHVAVTGRTDEGDRWGGLPSEAFSLELCQDHKRLDLEQVEDGEGGEDESMQEDV